MDAVIIDSGGANLASLQFAFERLGAKTRVTADAAEIRSAPRVILPGVGSAANAMARLRNSHVAELLPLLTQPVLGICLGMQLLFARSEEGETECLGILPEKANEKRRMTQDIHDEFIANLERCWGTGEDIGMPFSQMIKNKYPDSSKKRKRSGRG